MTLMEAPRYPSNHIAEIGHNLPEVRIGPSIRHHLAPDSNLRDLFSGKGKFTGPRYTLP